MHGEAVGDAPRVAFPVMPAASLAPQIAPGVATPPDITGRGWTAEELCALLDLVPAEIAIWDTSFRNVFANSAAVRWFGRSDRAEVAGRHAQELLGPELYMAANIAYSEAALLGEPQQFDRTVVHPTGLRHLQVYCAPRMREGEVTGIYSFVVDVTHRVEAELALQEARAELAAARERERIADDLHNLVIQRLFAAGLAAASPADVADAQVRSVQDGILAALDDLETAMTTLHESVALLDLLPDLVRTVHAATQPRGIAAAVENVGSVEYVPQAAGVELLAAAEASLANVAAHSGASNVVVTIAADPTSVWLRVVDDGRGLGAESPGRTMTELCERAENLGGTCTWRPNEPFGTLFDWRIPTPH
jgi:PAS domain S-box-containing protein